MAGWQDAPIVNSSAKPSWMDAPIVGGGEPQKPAVEVIATTDDGGAVYRDAGGALSFSSPGYSTNDPARIEEIMKGAKPVDLVQRDVDQQRIAENPIAARAQEFVRGTPFVGSYADEAVGMFSPQAGANMEATSQAMQRQNPGETMALRLAGGVATTAPIAAVAAPALAGGSGMTLGTKAMIGASVGGVGGATEGAIYGAGEQGGAGRAENARQGGIFGGIAGGALGGAAPYVATGVKEALSRLRGSDVSVISKELGISAPAARVVKNALDAGDMVEAEKALMRSGEKAMLADAGQPARELLDAAANAGGGAGRTVRNAVETRAEASSKDMTKALDTYLGKPSGRMAAKEGVRTGTQAAREAAYSAAYSKPIDYASSRGMALERMLSRVPESAIRKANSLMKLEGVDSAQIMAKIADDGAVTFTKMPDVRQIDYITRAMGDVADAAHGQGKLGGTTAEGRALEGLTRNIRNLLKGSVPEYKKALDVASDAITESKAIDTGYELLRAGTKRDVVARAVAGASKAEKEAMKQGLRSHIDDTLANVARTVTDPNTDAREAIKLARDLSSRANQQKLTMVLGKKNARALLDQIDKEVASLELRAAVATNSKTAIRQSIQGGVSDQAAPGALEMLSSGQPIEAGRRFVQLFTGNSAEAQALREQGIYQDIAKALTEVRGAKARQALKVVQKAMNGQAVTEQQAAFVGNVVATTFGVAGSREGARALQSQ